jgi:putative addiction module antidote
VSKVAVALQPIDAKHYREFLQEEPTMQSLRVTQIGNSLGVIFPKEIINHLRVSKGDSLYVTLSPNGLEVSMHNAELTAEIAMGQAFMNEYGETFKVLAK